jgi:hypothetical protein
MLIILFLASCNTMLAPTPTNTPKPTNTPIRETLTPIVTQTKTLIPTATPLREITAEDVGLPWDNNLALENGIATVQYKPCDVGDYDLNKPYHRGQIFMWRLKEDQEIIVVSPIDGTIVYAVENWKDSSGRNTGVNLFTTTPFLLKDDEGYYQQVHYQINHFDELWQGIQVGIFVKRGQPIGILRGGGVTDPGGHNILDIAFILGATWHGVDERTLEGRARLPESGVFYEDNLANIFHTEVVCQVSIKK